MRAVLVLALAASLAQVQSAEIIVLVHGLLGWGPGKGLDRIGKASTRSLEGLTPPPAGLNYWGMTTDLEYDIRSQIQAATGLATYAAAVGAVSANRERAAELYAQILGVHTDYGAVRSGAWNFSRFAPVNSSLDFSYAKPFLPKWCLGGNTDKIHFIGHSMGGPTIRMLERLLQAGDPAEVAASGSDVSPLYDLASGAHRASCIASITTLASLHDGTPLCSKESQIQGNIANVLKGYLSGFVNTIQS
jgi:triacylglycerol esterase/lipase EstA (alpha/beta hydrolase family)